MVAEGNKGLGPCDDEHELGELFASYVDQLNRGDDLDPQEILAKHPLVGERLLACLEDYVGAGTASIAVQLQTLGDYTLRRQIGRGGMGVVYDAWQNSLDRQVALKVLPVGIAADDRTFHRFMREAKTAARLNHENVVRVFGMGVESNTPYFAMEYVDGKTLGQLLAKREPGTDEVIDTPFGRTKEGLVDYPRIATAFAGMADGLHHAHSKGVIHRDIKPSNLILDGSGRLRILDFGLARLEGQEGLTLTHDVVGTPLYMSPEQARRRKIPIDHRTDIYSLGATLYEMLTRRPPFRGKDNYETLSQIIANDPSPLRRFDPTIPKSFETIVLKCLRKNPKDRYDTAEAVAEDLRRFARGDPVEAQPLPPWAGIARRAWKNSPRIGVFAMAATLVFLLVSSLMPTEGMVTRQVWAPALDTEGGVSPDGRYLSYVNWDTGDLALRDLTTGKNRNLTDKGSWSASDEFAQVSRMSPDGMKVAYAWFNEKFYELRIIGLDGSKPRVVYANEEVFYIQPAAWSPDGKHILAWFGRKDKTNQIVLVSTANGSVRVLKTLDWRYPLNLSLSPDGRYVVYDLQSEEDSSGHDIFLLAIDGSREIPLIKHAADDLLPVWAPDGNRIVFASDRTGAMGLWTLQVVNGKPPGLPELIKKNIGKFKPIGFTGDGSLYYSVDSGIPDVYTARLDVRTGKLLAPATGVAQRFVGTNFSPDYSPDGKYMLYLSQRGQLAYGVGSRVLVIRSLESGKERVLLPELTFSRRRSLPRWSPDGRSILVTGSDLKGRGGCYRIDAQTGQVTSLVQREPNKGGGVSQAVWSTDGKAILFRRGGSLVVRDLDNGQEKVLYSCDHIHAWALSSDGRQLALTVPSDDQAKDAERGASNSNVLLVMPATGGETRELFRVPAEEEITAVVWTPDGGQLLFARASGPLNEKEGLWRISAEGGRPRALGLDLTAKQLASLRFHPDGARVAFTAGEREEEVWVMENFLPESKVAAASGMATRQVWAHALDTMGTVSPNGRYLSYVNWDTGNLALHDLTTGENRDLTDEGTWETPWKFCDVSIWSPDSRRIAYYWIGRERSLRIVGLDGSKPRVLASSNSVRAYGVPWPRAWSQDGKYILAVSYEKNESLTRGEEGHIVLVSVADGSVRVLNSLGERHCPNASLSPDGRYVVFELDPKPGSKKGDIHLLATDGSGEIALVEHPADDNAPFWAPDGKRIVFFSDRSGSKGLWMLDVDNGKPKGTPTLVKEMGKKSGAMGFTRDGSLYYSVRTPTNDVYVATLDFEAGKVLALPTKISLRFEGSNYSPFWSRDGKYLAYASRRSTGPVLVIRSVESGQERDLSPETMGMPRMWAAPRWSPDGASILITGLDGKGSHDLCLVDMQTGDFTRVVHDEFEGEGGKYGTSFWPVFSNDGKQIYFIRGDRSIVTRNLETRRDRELYRANTYIYRLALSPDGRRLAFLEAAAAMRPTVVRTIPASGGDPRELYTLKEGKRFSWGVGLAWTPDGRHVVVGGPDAPDKPDELWSIPATGGEPRKLNLGVKVNHLSLHPDGRRIAFTGSDPKGGQEVWVMENFLP